MKRLIAMLLALCMILAWIPASVQAEELMRSGDLNAQALTRQQIRDKWATVTTAQTLYAEEPSVQAPYAAGKLSDDLLESGITYLNFVRYIANLPQVRLDAALTENAQYGAVVLAANNQLSHYPSKPADMDRAFYDAGYAAASSSNISMRYGSSVNDSLQSSIRGCMADKSSVSNLSAVGHRRWLLNPRLQNVGFGFARATTGACYVTTKVFDRSGPVVNYDFVSWPASGNFPADMFDTATPWSVSLNPSKYRTPDQSQVKITITEVHGGKQWTFDGNTGEPVSASQAYMRVDTVGYGSGPCIIFHPGSQNVVGYKGVFTVEITGIFTKSGTPATVRYQVDFFNLDGSAEDSEHSYIKTVTKPTCLEPGYTTYTCTGCGHSYQGDATEPLGHNYTLLAQTQPTPNNDGMAYYICTRCDANYSQTIPYNCNHNYSHRVVEPGCTGEGYTVHTCGKCGHYYLDTYVPALGHDSKANPGFAATCTENGMTDGSYCSRCLAVIVEREVIPSTGHTPVADPAVDPTCARPGRTEGSHCGACGLVFEKPETVPAKPHDYQIQVAQPTCSQEGHTRHTCSACESTYITDVKSPTGAHAFTDDKDTSCNVCGYVRELGIKTTPMYRLYNPNSGEHFYTGSEEERDSLVEAGWQYEGVAWNAPTNKGDPVFRLYNPNNGDHHYTMSAEERDDLVELGWQYEGVAWNSAAPGNLPLYRLYNPNADCGSHHYTGSDEERDFLVSVGWKYEGIGWFGLLK